MDIKKIKKSAKKKQKEVKPKKIKKFGNVSRKRRMKNAIIVTFILATLLIRKNCNNSV